MNCLLCNSIAIEKYHSQIDREWYFCLECASVFVPNHILPSFKKEKRRYQLHENNPTDIGFQKFVSPLAQTIKNTIPEKHTGLDFGSGTGSAVGKLVREAGYNLFEYDPFFKANRSVLDSAYDFIICCEVIEHFHHPLKEFELLYSLLKPGASLFSMTNLLPERSEFPIWYYKNDLTHVLFYSIENLEWIKKKVGFSGLKIEGRVITLTK
jgi:SAM-dependent methyltransferase